MNPALSKSLWRRPCHLRLWLGLWTDAGGAYTAGVTRSNPHSVYNKTAYGCGDPLIHARTVMVWSGNDRP